jgi:RNA polymerase sigma-54 factor
MAIGIKQSLKLTQQLLMTPQLQQAIKLLQLSRLELEEFVSQQLEENPVLEEDNRTHSEDQVREKERTESEVADQSIGEEAAKMLDSNGSQEPDWESFSRHKESDAPIPSTMQKKDSEAPNYENFVSRAKTLAEHLTTQISDIDLSDEEIKIARFIIGNIDDRGYLQLTLDEIVDELKVDIDLIEGVLDSVQRLDPVGVAAQDLKECLLLQIKFLKLKNGVVEKIVENHLKDLEIRNYQAIAKSLQINIQEVVENIQIIAGLEPIPGRQFAPDATQYVVPDVYIFKVGDEWSVGMNEDGLPPLQISKLYQDLMKETGKAEDKEYLSEKIKSAQWLIKSIQQRQKTIYRVAEAILQKQIEFFEQGIEHLRPMILKDIADELELHESTISRVTTNKYVHTPRGIFELKFFFNSSITTKDGDGMASESVKRLISDFIKTEDPKKPYSDQRIVEYLEEKGIELARRTVAKYREQLNISPSSRRKKLY